MPMWDQIVDVLRESIFAYAQVFNGNLGAGILAVSFLGRLGLLPLGIHLARKARRQQQLMARLRPALDSIKAKYKSDPKRLADETRRLLAREGGGMLVTGGCVGGLVQGPVLLALYAGVKQAARSGGRFLWIRSLADPSWSLAIGATLLTMLATGAGAASPQNRTIMLAISASITLVVLTKMSAGVALYWTMSSLFGSVQAWIVNRKGPTIEHRRPHVSI